MLVKIVCKMILILSGDAKDGYMTVWKGSLS